MIAPISGPRQTMNRAAVRQILINACGNHARQWRMKMSWISQKKYLNPDRVKPIISRIHQIGPGYFMCNRVGSFHRVPTEWAEGKRCEEAREEQIAASRRLGGRRAGDPCK